MYFRLLKALLAARVLHQITLALEVRMQSAIHFSFGVLRLTRRIDLILGSFIILGSFLISACGNSPDKNGDGSFDPNLFGNGYYFPGGINGNDFKNKVNELDGKIASGQLGGTGNYTYDPETQNTTGGLGNSPIDGKTPAATSVGDHDFIQNFTDFQSIFGNLNNAAGVVKMVTTYESSSGSQIERINTIIMDKEFGHGELDATLNLGGPREGFSYPPGASQEFFCSLVHIDAENRKILKTNELPLSFDPATMEVGDPVCPIERKLFNLAEGEHGKIRLEIETEPLPKFESTRSTIKSLGRYGDFTPGPSNIIFYESKVESRNAANEISYVINSYFFILDVLQMEVPGQLSPYQYKGKFGDSEYYMILPSTPFKQIKTQAALLGVAVGANEAYGVAITSQEELEFIKGIIPGNRVWMGLDDIASEGSFKLHSEEVFSFSNWASGEPNNDGNEDCAHLNYSRGGDWNDTECYHAYPVLIEVKVDSGSLQLP